MKLTKVALAGVVSFSAVLAAGAPTFADTAATMKSHTDVSFTQNEKPVNPVNPVDPGEDVVPNDDPNDPHEPGTKGPLSIDYVSNFHFGEQKMSGNDKVYTAQLDKVKVKGSGEEKQIPNYVQVTDDRGTNKGWKLTVKQDAQFKAGNDELTGAELKLHNPVANSTIDMKYAPDVKEVTLNPNGATQEVAIARDSKGMGTWVTHYGKDNVEGAKSVTLSVPGTTAKVKDAKYETTLTWALEDTPQ
ncbi:WxL domain-containing protein [Bacillus cytotoxicus]|uniref:WxL domain-containing protein n=1 Tax=Bacillus cereus group sp. BfR-BA-01492 TaxID=2920361 RepID=UPI001F563570|nr:WxL domain-containing protein [Bacillus cereus group sp. BfR-BA-01492]EMA6344133.1 WxL domain-containing protein [Bacillus cytotoxicus]